MLWMLTNGKTLTENDKAVNALHLRVQCDVCATPALDSSSFALVTASRQQNILPPAASVEATALNAADAVPPPNDKKTQMRETRI
jgi:hypothetical protein